VQSKDNTCSTGRLDARTIKELDAYVIQVAEMNVYVSKRLQLSYQNKTLGHQKSLTLQVLSVLGKKKCRQTAGNYGFNRWTEYRPYSKTVLPAYTDIALPRSTFRSCNPWSEGKTYRIWGDYAEFYRLGLIDFNGLHGTLQGDLCL
jgi:hypothetical protein